MVRRRERMFVSATNSPLLESSSCRRRGVCCYWNYPNDPIPWSRDDDHAIPQGDQHLPHSICCVVDIEYSSPPCCREPRGSIGMPTVVPFQILPVFCRLSLLLLVLCHTGVVADEFSCGRFPKKPRTIIPFTTRRSLQDKNKNKSVQYYYYFLIMMFSSLYKYI